MTTCLYLTRIFINTRRLLPAEMLFITLLKSSQLLVSSQGNRPYRGNLTILRGYNNEKNADQCAPI